MGNSYRDGNTRPHYLPLASMGFPGGLAVKNSPAMQETRVDVGAIPGSGRSTGGGNGNLLQCSCLENPMDGDYISPSIVSLYLH